MDWLLLAIIVGALLGAYLLPSVVAVARKAPSAGSTVVINVLLGWTLVGWAVALAMACRSSEVKASVHVRQHVGPVQPQDPNPPW